MIVRLTKNANPHALNAHYRGRACDNALRKQSQLQEQGEASRTHAACFPRESQRLEVSTGAYRPNNPYRNPLTFRKLTSGSSILLYLLQIPLASSSINLSVPPGPSFRELEAALSNVASQCPVHETNGSMPGLSSPIPPIHSFTFEGSPHPIPVHSHPRKYIHL